MVDRRCFLFGLTALALPGMASAHDEKVMPTVLDGRDAPVRKLLELVLTVYRSQYVMDGTVAGFANVTAHFNSLPQYLDTISKASIPRLSVAKKTYTNPTEPPMYFIRAASEMRPTVNWESSDAALSGPLTLRTAAICLPEGVTGAVAAESSVGRALVMVGNQPRTAQASIVTVGSKIEGAPGRATVVEISGKGVLMRPAGTSGQSDYLVPLTGVSSL